MDVLTWLCNLVSHSMPVFFWWKCQFRVVKRSYKNAMVCAVMTLGSTGTIVSRVRIEFCDFLARSWISPYCSIIPLAPPFLFQKMKSGRNLFSVPGVFAKNEVAGRGELGYKSWRMHEKGARVPSSDVRLQAVLEARRMRGEEKDWCRVCIIWAWKLIILRYTSNLFFI